MIKNKKAVTEITSFVLITLLIIIASISAYAYSQRVLENTIVESDRNKMENNLKQLDQIISNLLLIDESTTSINMQFNRGKISFTNNQISYQSLLDYDNEEEFCNQNICSKSNAGSELLYLNLTAPYQFESNSDLLPGYYIITLTHNKNESEISVSFR